MQAIAYDRFGGIEVLQLVDRPRPVARAGEVVVAMRATSLNVIDSRIRRGEMGFPLVDRRFPKVPGADVAGVVAEVGPGVTGLSAGDAVLGATNPFRGGAMAEAVAVPARQLARLPAGIGFDAAAALPVAGLAALHAVTVLGQVKAGQEVLVHGASGAVGLFAVQMARQAGARVTGVCGAGGLAEVARLGAERVIDYRGPQALDPGARFDLILNASGQMPFGRGRAFLKPRGRLVEPSPDIATILTSALSNPVRGRKHLMLLTSPATAALERLAAMAASGGIEATIARRYPLAEAAEAFARMEAGGVVGKIVITFGA